MTDPVDTDALRNPPWSNLDAIGGLLDAAADEVDRLRDVIKNAPHANGCSWFSTSVGLSCNCWKRGVL